MGKEPVSNSRTTSISSDHADPDSVAKDGAKAKKQFKGRDIIKKVGDVFTKKTMVRNPESLWR